MFEFRNTKELKPEVIAILDPIKSALKALNNGHTEAQIRTEIAKIITDNTSQLQKMESDYNPNAQACYKYIFSKMQKGLVTNVATQYFAHKDNPLAKILSQAYQLETSKQQSEQTKKPLGIKEIMFSGRGFIIDGGYFDDIVRSSDQAYKAVFNTVALGTKGIVRAGKVMFNTAKSAGKVISKVGNAFNSNPPTTPTP